MREVRDVKDEQPIAANLPLLLAVSSLGAILAPLNSTMVAVALPDIRAEFSLSHGAVAWLVSGYLIAMAVAMPIGGRLGDQIGRKRVFRAGLIAFLALAIATSLSTNFPMLVALRVVQAAAGAVLIPNGMAMLRTHAPVGRLGRLNGINGAVVSFAAAVGPLIGAGVLVVGSWRWIFPISVPFILIALFLLRGLDTDEPVSTSRTAVDWIGASLFVGMLVLLTLQLTAVRGGVDPFEMALGCAGAVAFAGAFAWRQRVTSAPAAEWSLFKMRSFSAAASYILLTNLTMYTTLLMIPFFVRDVLEKSTEEAGLLLGAMSVLVAVTAPVGGLLSDARGRRWPAQIGAVFMFVAAVALLAGLSSTVSSVYLAGCLALLGLGLGLGAGAANTAAVEAAPRALAGSAAGTSSMMRYVGSIVGAGILAGVLNDHSGAGGDVMTFRLATCAVIATASLAVIASMGIHKFARPEAVLVRGERETAPIPRSELATD